MKEIIEEICKANKITKATYAYKLGVTPTMLSRWITKKSLPRINIFYQIMDDYRNVFTSDTNTES